MDAPTALMFQQQHELIKTQGNQIRVLFKMIRLLEKEVKKCSKQDSSLPLV